MPSYRKRRHQKVYAKHTKAAKKADACQFCEIDQSYPQFVNKGQHFKIIQNIFPYDVWDGMRVSEHLLLIPTTHTENLGTLEPAAKLEFVELISKYEVQGYDVYARSLSVVRSVPHQHTHLIKTTGKTIRGTVYLKRPYTTIIW